MVALPLALARPKTIIFREYFFMFHFFRHEIFRRRSTDIFDALPHGVALSVIEALLYGLPQSGPNINERQDPNFCQFSCRTAIHLTPPFLNEKENRKCNTIVSITDYCRTRWHKFGDGQPTNNGDWRASLHVGWGDFATFGNTTLCLWNGTRQAHNDHGRLIGCHRRSIEWWHCRWPWVTLAHISETTKPISFKLGVIFGIRQ